MEAYLEEVCKTEKRFSGLELQHVPRGTNKEADDIAKRASRREPQKPGIFEERLLKPSAAAAPPTAGPALLLEEPPLTPSPDAPACGPTSGARLLLALEPQEGCWTEELKACLLRGTLPKKEEDCISKEQGRELLPNIHGGDCGNHSSSRTLVGKAFHSVSTRPRRSTMPLSW
ncbi:uncharacterized protein [Aegilops tauschii subsp. strangulata]|uniref:uncharacterized protein n=1 Tax=Aegilops tauschii subsp. strangulata TaxID=200361 RepID=UPI003CC8BE0E